MLDDNDNDNISEPPQETSMDTDSMEAEGELNDTGTVCYSNNEDNHYNFATSIAEQSATLVEDFLPLPSIALSLRFVLVETMTEDNNDKLVVPVETTLPGSLWYMDSVPPSVATVIDPGPTYAEEGSGNSVKVATLSPTSSIVLKENELFATGAAGVHSCPSVADTRPDKLVARSMRLYTLSSSLQFWTAINTQRNVMGIWLMVLTDHKISPWRCSLWMGWMHLPPVICLLLLLLHKKFAFGSRRLLNLFWQTRQSIQSLCLASLISSSWL